MMVLIHSPLGGAQLCFMMWFYSFYIVCAIYRRYEVQQCHSNITRQLINMKFETLV